MPNKTSNVSFRIDSDLKTQADSLFAELGLNMTTAFNIFLRRAVQDGGIPFPVAKSRVPNAETLAAMQETEDILAGRIQTKQYSSFKEFLVDLNAEGDDSDAEI